MEFPELTATLVYNDCIQVLPEYAARLQRLAQANGSNLPLTRYLDYFNKTKITLNADQLKQFADQGPKAVVGVIDSELEEAALLKDEHKYPSSLAIAIQNAEEDANNYYVKHGYWVAGEICKHSFPDIFNGSGRRIMEKRYGEDEINWRWEEFSQEWLLGYLAKNPFNKNEDEEDEEPLDEHARVLATGITVEDKEVTRTTFSAIPMAAVITTPLTWLWPERIPLGVTCWFTGKPGIGKSLATLDVVACLTTGRDWPDGEKNSLPPQDVLLFISEDMLDKVVKPRLLAAGADISHIEYVPNVKLDKGSRELQLKTDLGMLKRALIANPKISLIVLDPLESFLGDVNINVNQEVRPIVNGLKRICEKTNTTIIGILHDNKRQDVSAIQKIPGGSAIAGAARAALGFSRDTENPNEFYMSMVKGSFSKKQTGIKYTISEKEIDGIKAAYLVWGDEHDSTEDDLLNVERDTKGRQNKKQITLADEFLPAALAKGPRWAHELYDEAGALGISSDTLKRAKSKLESQGWKIDVYVPKEGQRRPTGTGRWVWERIKVTEDETIPDGEL